MISRRLFLSAGAGATSLLAGCEPDARKSRELTKVQFGMLPYGDHTQAIIGVKKGWFNEVGIDLQYNVIKIEEVVPFLAGGHYDVVSTPPGVLLAGYNQSPGLVMATFGDLFQGFALLGRPDEGLRSYSEFVAEGVPAADALKRAVLQLRGKRFAYPPEGGVRPFIDLLLDTAGITASAFDAVVVDDPIGVSTMLRHGADFHVGGVPARLTLQKAGFKVIVSAVDFARLAQPSSDSKALQAILPGGWAMQRNYYEKNRQLVLKLAEVSFRISDFMRSNFREAASIHMAYLSKVTGQPYDLTDAKIIYNDLDPFLTFEEQSRWFEDPSYPFYFQHLIGAQIKSFEDDKAFKGSVPKVKDIIRADEVYAALKRARATCESRDRSSAVSLAAFKARDYLSCGAGNP